MGPQCAAPGSALRDVVAGRIAIARRGTGVGQYNKPPNRTRGAGWAARVGADPTAAAQCAPSSGGRSRGSASRTLARCSHWAATTRLEDQDLAQGLAGIYDRPFAQHVYCAASNGTDWEPLPSGRTQQAEIPRQKKKRNLKRLRLRFHQRRRFWRSAPPPVRRRHNQIIPKTRPKCKRLLLLCIILRTINKV